MKEFYKLDSDGQEASEAFFRIGVIRSISLYVQRFELLYFKRIAILKVDA